VIVAIAATWDWLTRVMLPGHQNRLYPPFASFEVALFFDVCGLKEGASSFLRIWAKWC
jgi:hypothetical protein